MKSNLTPTFCKEGLSGMQSRVGNTESSSLTDLKRYRLESGEDKIPRIYRTERQRKGSWAEKRLLKFSWSLLESLAEFHSVQHKVHTWGWGKNIWGKNNYQGAADWKLPRATQNQESLELFVFHTALQLFQHLLLKKTSRIIISIQDLTWVLATTVS